MRTTLIAFTFIFLLSGCSFIPVQTEQSQKTQDFSTTEEVLIGTWVETFSNSDSRAVALRPDRTWTSELSTREENGLMSPYAPGDTGSWMLTEDVLRLIVDGDEVYAEFRVNTEDVAVPELTDVNFESNMIFKLQEGV